MDKQSDKYRIWFVYLALLVSTLVVFWQVHSFEFINYDDNDYVYKNKYIFTGLKRDNIVWVFTHGHGGNFHPLTGLSHILDCELFGLNPGRHHVVNLLFHLANTLLLFTVLRKMTASLWQSAFVAALFALNPLHVEPVAWISSRKDVLSTLFLMLTIDAYHRYVKNPAASRYILTLTLFAFGLMAKPMLVTLPFVLLLLDYWPLNRLENSSKGNDGGKNKVISKPGTWKRLVWEKIPFFIASGISSIITVFVFRSIGLIKNTRTFPFSVRIVNASVSYIKYIEKLFVPSHLAAFYPHPGDKLPLWQALAAVTLLIGITISILRLGNKYKYLPVGWFWYLGTLVPVIGLIQVGDQAMADRYTYISFIGLFIIVAWGTNDLLIRWKYRRIALGISAAAIILVLSICTFFQTQNWRNSQTFFEHALKVTSDNYVACNNLALALDQQNKFDEAINYLHRALQINPHYLDAYNNLITIYGKLGRYQEAIDACLQAIKLNPAGKSAAAVYNNLGLIYLQAKKYQEAIQAFRKAIRIKPDSAEAHCGLGIAYFETGDKDSAMKEYEILKKIDMEKTNIFLEFIQKQNTSQ